jgi:hypothetical protein
MEISGQLHSLTAFFFLWSYIRNLGLGLPPWNSRFHFGFLDLRHLVGPLGRVISSLQDLSTCTQTQKNGHTHTNTKHLSPRWKSNPRSRFPSERRQCMPQTARLPWAAPGRFTPREIAPNTHVIGGWMGPRTGLNDVWKRKFFTLPALELWTLGRPARSQSLYRLRYPGSPHWQCVAQLYWILCCTVIHNIF